METAFTVLWCYQKRKKVINNKEANVSLGVAEQLQALRQKNWIEMNDHSCKPMLIIGCALLLESPHYC